MKTPICDFVRRYADSGAARFHMPGHKGVGDMERYDITEICGADSLYEAEGVIAESEANASEIFGCRTFYSTEGSSQCIRAMLFLALQRAGQRRKSPVVVAGRNAHKVFLSAAALLDLGIRWLYPSEETSYLSCDVDLRELEKELKESNAFAVYITSPDYLGNVADISKISAICRKYGAELIVDNAHGAYLKHLSPSLHPIELGASMCCDSAHKTLPVLTGGAYLHLSNEIDSENVKEALALFGSTSPSYLILQSLDRANIRMAEEYVNELRELCGKIDALKHDLSELGYRIVGNEPLKITVSAKEYGYYGYEIAEYLRNNGVECEFSDPDHVVLMISTDNTDADINTLEKLMRELPQKAPVNEKPPVPAVAEVVMSVREAMFSPCEKVAVKDSIGRVLADASVGCPPAVPIVVCGERIDADAIRCFEYYGVEYCLVVK